VQSDPIGILLNGASPGMKVAQNIGIDALPSNIPDGYINHLYGYVKANPLKSIDPFGLVDCGWWNDNCSAGDPPNSKPKCVTGECAAGLPPVESDHRSACQVKKDGCKLVCSISAGVAGLGIGKAFDGGIVAFGAIQGEKYSICKVICGAQHGFD